MQKRSIQLEVRSDPIPLPPSFPILNTEPFEQKDQPITYLHWHQCLEIGYCYSGSGIFMVGEKVLLFQPEDISIINHTEVHLAQSAPGTSSRWIWIYVDPILLVGHPGLDTRHMDTSPFAGPNFQNLFSSARHPQIQRNVLRMIEELKERKVGRNSVLRALVWELMILLNRVVPGRRRASSNRQHYDRVAPALQFISQNYRNAVNILALAKSCHLSIPHFRRLFIRALGCSPRQYWHAMRLRMAASLLQTTSSSVLEISHNVGFETPSSFNRQFRAFYLNSPRQWRLSNGKSGIEKSRNSLRS